VVWIDAKMSVSHDVRVLVSYSAKVVERSEWVELNRDVIIRYWDGDIDTKDVLDALKPLQRGNRVRTHSG
jgi:hypothetical protein